MRSGLRRLRGAVLMGLTWAVLWWPIGPLLGMILDPDGSMDEPWFLVGVIPGMLCGAAFSAVLAIAARRRRLDELSLPRAAAWGALAGMLTGAFPFLIGDSSGNTSLLTLATIVISSITVLGAVSAAGSLALAQRAERRELGDADADVAAVGLTRDEAKELLGRRE